LHWAHANGFNAQTYGPLLAPLAGDFDVYAADARGHGLSTLAADPAQYPGWTQYRNDLISVVEHLCDKAGGKIWLGGHSMGGCASVMAASIRPDLVAGLVLADPVIVPRSARVLARMMFRNQGGFALAVNAAKRRADWPDAETVKKAYTGRGAFRTWQDGFLEAYVDGGVRPLNGDGENTVTLACAPAWEAANFNDQRHNSTGPARRLKVPFTLMVAESGSTTRSVLSFRMARAPKKIEVIAGSSHFLPMEFPDRVRAEIYARAGMTR
jgi:pimeloyl-ACP methyl ester carboxylesterase